jgi:hypothetical protein
VFLNDPNSPSHSERNSVDEVATATVLPLAFGFEAARLHGCAASVLVLPLPLQF